MLVSKESRSRDCIQHIHGGNIKRQKNEAAVAVAALLVMFVGKKRGE